MLFLFQQNLRGHCASCTMVDQLEKMYSYLMVFWTDESSDPLQPHLLIPVPGELFTLIHFSSSITRSRNDFGKAECNEDDLFRNKNKTTLMHLTLAFSKIPYYSMIQIAKSPFYLKTQIKIHWVLYTTIILLDLMC